MQAHHIHAYVAPAPATVRQTSVLGPAVLGRQQSMHLFLTQNPDARSRAGGGAAAVRLAAAPASAMLCLHLQRWCPAHL